MVVVVVIVTVVGLTDRVDDEHWPIIIAFALVCLY